MELNGSGSQTNMEMGKGDVRDTLEEIPFMGPDTTRCHYAPPLLSLGETASCLCSKWNSQGSLCPSPKTDYIFASREDNPQCFPIPC